MKRWLIVVAALALFSGRTAHASSEVVHSFDSQVTVAASGRVDVTETIDYDFGTTPHHGIYRYIPTRYKDTNGTAYRPSLTYDGAQVDGAAAQTNVSTDGDNKVLKIGDPNATITGDHMYIVRYHFASLLVDRSGDLLRYNVTGNGWLVPIESASVTITGPGSVPKLTCYTGPVGSTAHNCTIDTVAQKITTNDSSFGDGLTIEALWPAGSVSTLLQPYKDPWWYTMLLSALPAYLSLSALILLAAFGRWVLMRLRRWRMERAQTVIAQYEAPKNLLVGEIGLLTDNKTTYVEVTATLLDLAVRGYLTIKQTQAKSLFKAADYLITKHKDFASLDPSESALITGLMDGKDELQLSAINHFKAPRVVKTFRKDLQTSVKTKGLYTAKSFSLLWVGAGAGVAIIIFFVLALAPVAGVVLLLGLLPIAIAAFIRAGRVPQYTPAGIADWAYIQGFKLFLSITEKDRLAFTDAPDKTPEQFSKFLPYAIALGVEKQWAKQFEGIDVRPGLGWYSGYSDPNFSAYLFVTSLNQSFAPTIMSSSGSQASGGGFGGGFSGGGFGGGGGGGW